MTPAERFWAKVDKNGPVMPGMETPCWVWTAATQRHGYGAFHRGGAKTHLVPAHRFSWELTHGPITDGRHVCHRCDNPPCVRPDHLFLGTRSDNMRDCTAKGRSALPHYTGAANPATKLTEEQVREIRASADSRKVTARKYGISPSLVGAIRKRQVWSHLP